MTTPEGFDPFQAHTQNSPDTQRTQPADTSETTAGKADTSESAAGEADAREALRWYEEDFISTAGAGVDEAKYAELVARGSTPDMWSAQEIREAVHRHLSQGAHLTRDPITGTTHITPTDISPADHAPASETGHDRADTTDAQSQWLVFDPDTREFVDLPVDHPLTVMLAQSTPIDDTWLDTRAAEDTARESTATNPQVDGAQVADEVVDDEGAESAYWTWVPTKDEQARIDDVIEYAGLHNTGPSPLQALEFADWLDEENSYTRLALAAQGDLSTVWDEDDLKRLTDELGLADNDARVEAARTEIQALRRDLDTDLDADLADLLDTATADSGAAAPGDLAPGSACTRPGTQSAVVIDQQWWTDRAHDTTTGHGTDTSTGTDAGSDVGSDVGSEHDDGWSH